LNSRARLDGAAVRSQPVKYRLGIEQNPEVGSQLDALLLKKRLLPNAAWTGVVMIAREGEHRQAQLADGAASRSHGIPAGGSRVKKIAGNDNELRLLFARHRPESFNHPEPLLLQAGALFQVIHTGEGLA
jgi:hypothetical protein